MSDTYTFGEVLDELLKSKGIRKTQIAKEVGMTDAAIHRLINNSTSPSSDRIMKIIAPLGYDLAVVKSGSKLPKGSFVLHQAKEVNHSKKAE